MTYFTWKEEGLTNDCETLDSMASRFEESARLMRKMSALVAPNGQETIIPMAVFACEKCGHVNKEFADVAGIQ